MDKAGSVGFRYMFFRDSPFFVKFRQTLKLYEKWTIEL